MAEDQGPRVYGQGAEGPGAEGLSMVMMEYVHACIWRLASVMCSFVQSKKYVFVDGRFRRHLLAIFNKLCEILDWILDI